MQINATLRFILLTVILTACRDQPFIAKLRCGMTREQVTELARHAGYDTSDPAWLSRAMSTKKSKQLTLVDLTFRGGRLIAVRTGVYDPRAKRVTYQTRDLCASEAQSHSQPR